MKNLLGDKKVTAAVRAAASTMGASETAASRDYSAWLSSLSQTQVSDVLIWVAYERLGAARRGPGMTHGGQGFEGF